MKFRVQTNTSMDLKYLFLIQQVLLLSKCVSGFKTSLSNNTHSLHKSLLHEYNPDIRPCLDCATPLFIGLELHLTTLNKIDEIEGELNTVGFLKIVWMDERLTWDPHANGLTSILLPSTKIWTPVILLGNPSNEITHLNAEDAIARVLYNGTVIWLPGDIFRSRCAYDVHNYPFDRQSCSIVFTPWSYLASEISFYAVTDHVITSFYQENGGWKLGPTYTSTYTKKGNSFLRFHFTFIRRSEFFVVNIIVPISFLSFLNCLAFAVPIESGERVSYTITVLLSFAVFMTLVSDNIPKSSAPMSLLCYYLTSLFSGSVLIMTSVMMNMRIFHTDPSVQVSYPYIRVYKALNCFRGKNSSRSQAALISSNDDEHQNTHDGTVNKTEPNALITWSDIAKAFDKLGLIISLTYFTCITLCMILYTTLSKHDSQ